MDVRAGDGKGVIAAINIVPLIDVLLVLIIIFMVISPADSLGLSAQISEPSPVSAPPQASTVVVRVLAAGRVSINQDTVSWQDLGSRLQSIFSYRSEKVAFIDGGNTVDFADVARAMDIMRTAGIDRVGLVSGNLRTER